MKKIVIVTILLAIALAADDDDTDDEGNVQSKDDSSQTGHVHGVPKTNCTCGLIFKSRHKRSYGGHDVARKQYKFLLPLVLNDLWSNVICGSAAITVWHALSAAHCTEDTPPRKFMLVKGAHDLFKVKNMKEDSFIYIKYKKEHKQYKKLKPYDIVILQFQDKVTFDNKVLLPICLPSKRMNLVNEQVKVIGWGDTTYHGYQAQFPREVDLTVKKLDVCLEYHMIDSEDFQKANQICLRDFYKGICQGDSGGPIVWRDPSIERWILVALVSFGPPCDSGKPSVHTDVSALIPWIQLHISKFNKNVQTCSKWEAWEEAAEWLKNEENWNLFV